ncbi:hypothetical protein CHH78_09790 [Shouchella clausii]|uniref:nitroreductase family protein n=1 Tax=Shouchella clausii TaxID=79880 RepID=UPI000BA55DAC|nr:nitroreductase family protein [Shouchella clausii]MCY1103139.1 nitroreductase family protein [Shouchella clausii]PAD08978.1 hypothetical protein CHH76_11335 [Shouchella clausii]PAE83105.1 hypothetical protein CHH78_09790 [Shouchella clausii]PAF05371.1 hypothetical protein CHH66_09770 [Shouchella clausii]
MKKIVKRLLSEEKRDLLITKKEAVGRNFSIFFLRIFSSTQWLSSIYYLFNTEFRREQQSVLKGRLIHLKDLQNKELNFYLLRRNIHRIEKGLLMKERKKVFAVRFINETVDCFLAALNNPSFINHPQKQWAQDVLVDYFEKTSSHPLRDEAYEKFKPYNEVVAQNDLKSVPYVRDNKQFNFDKEDLLELAKHRRSVRWFTEKKVEKDILDAAIEIASLSPTACNRQPYRFMIYQEADLVKKLAKIPMGTAGFDDNLTTLVAVVGDLSAYPYERDRHLIYIDSSLAAMSFIYGLEVQGVSSCVLNWPDMKKKEQQIKAFLKLNDEERVIMLIAVGYPDYTQKVAYSQKKPLNAVREII